MVPSLTFEREAFGSSNQGRSTMRAFAQAPKATQQITPAKSTIPGRVYFGQSDETSLLEENTVEVERSLTSAKTTRFGHDLSRIPVHAKVPVKAQAKLAVIPGIQAKLTVNAPGDIYEQEADRVSEQVIQMPEPQLQRDCPCCGSCPSCQEDDLVKPKVGRNKVHASLHIMTKGLAGQRWDSAPSDEEEEEGRVMREATPGDSYGGNRSLGNLLSRSRGSGLPLSGTIRTFMETRFGQDFGNVRIHTDSDAAHMTQALQAEAFTAGSDIYFQPGKFAPQMSQGKRLLAHELTHVVQQRGNATGSDRIGQKHCIQLYRLRGFPPDEAKAMKAAIPVATAKVLRCPSLNLIDRLLLSETIESIRYDYEEDLGACGYTFPLSWYIEIGKSAFDKNMCCDLASTIAHEAAHTQLAFEGVARSLECRCFGCSCQEE